MATPVLGKRAFCGWMKSGWRCRAVSDDCPDLVPEEQASPEKVRCLMTTKAERPSGDDDGGEALTAVDKLLQKRKELIDEKIRAMDRRDEARVELKKLDPESRIKYRYKGMVFVDGDIQEDPCLECVENLKNTIKEDTTKIEHIHSELRKIDGRNRSEPRLRLY